MSFQNTPQPNKFIANQINTQLLSALKDINIVPTVVVTIDLNELALTELHHLLPQCQIKSFTLAKLAEKNPVFELPIEDDSVDLVIADIAQTPHCDLEHIFSEVSRLLSKEALFIFACFDSKTKSNLPKLLPAFYKLDDILDDQSVVERLSKLALFKYTYQTNNLELETETSSIAYDIFFVSHDKVPKQEKALSKDGDTENGKDNIGEAIEENKEKNEEKEPKEEEEEESESEENEPEEKESEESEPEEVEPEENEEESEEDEPEEKEEESESEDDESEEKEEEENEEDQDSEKIESEEKEEKENEEESEDDEPEEKEEESESEDDESEEEENEEESEKDEPEEKEEEGEEEQESEEVEPEEKEEKENKEEQESEQPEENEEEKVEDNVTEESIAGIANAIAEHKDKLKSKSLQLSNSIDISKKLYAALSNPYLEQEHKAKLQAELTAEKIKHRALLEDYKSLHNTHAELLTNFITSQQQLLKNSEQADDHYHELIQHHQELLTETKAQIDKHEEFLAPSP